MRKIFFYLLTILVLLTAYPIYLLASTKFVEDYLCSAKYKPIERKIEGIPVEQIDESWSKVLPLTKNNFMGDLKLNKISISKEDRGKINHLKEHGFNFLIEGDFNNDGFKDKASVGIYQDKLGRLGNYFLVLTEYDNNKWRKDFLVKIPSEKLAETYFCLFSMLAGTGKEDDQIQWASSIGGTDTTYILVWENAKYALKYFGDYLPTVYKPGRN